MLPEFKINSICLFIIFCVSIKINRLYLIYTIYSCVCILARSCLVSFWILGLMSAINLVGNVGYCFSNVFFAFSLPSSVHVPVTCILILLIVDGLFYFFLFVSSLGFDASWPVPQLLVLFLAVTHVNFMSAWDVCVCSLTS